MIVVSDTTPISAFFRLDRPDLLQKFSPRIVIPPEVFRELGRAQTPGADALRDMEWLERREPLNQTAVSFLLSSLHRGEAEAIALAVELKADLLLIDEKPGRVIAKRRGLDIIGTAGIMIHLKRTGEIPSVKPLLDRLVFELGFRLNRELYTLVLETVGETV